MPVVNVQVTEDGLQVPSELVEQLGLQPGQEARLEIRHAPGAEEIHNCALRYAWRRLGDAVGVNEPEWDGGFWRVELKVRGRTGTFGFLTLTPEGAVVTERSTSKEELLERLHAGGSGSPA